MKISTEFNSTANYVGPERAIELLAKAGFDAWDFSMFDMCRYDWGTGKFYESNHPLGGKDYLKFARRLKQVADDNGIECNQSHAPFPSYPPIKQFLFRAIECTAEAGGKICVIHPDNNKSAELNAEMYFELLPFAKEHGVKIATENMWNWDGEKDQAADAACSSPESFCAHLNAVNDDYFVACLDIGHAEMRGLNTSAVDMIYALGEKLQALHVHDNDKWHDLHQIPFSCAIDFEAVTNALIQTGYKGYITLESDAFLRGKTNETLFDNVKELAASARRIADRF